MTGPALSLAHCAKLRPRGLEGQRRAGPAFSAPGGIKTILSPVGFIQNEDLNAAQVEGGTVVQMVNEAARSGDEDVRARAQGCLLGLEVQATCNNTNSMQPSHPQTTSRSSEPAVEMPKAGPLTHCQAHGDAAELSQLLCNGMHLDAQLPSWHQH